MAVTATGTVGTAQDISNPPANPVNLTYTVAADADALDVRVSIARQGAGAVGTITGVTANGTPMTQVDTTVDAHPSGPFTRVYGFRLVAPSTGSQTIAVSWTGNATGIVVAAQGLKGVHQTTPITTSAVANSGTGTSSPAAVTVTGASDEYILQIACSQDTGQLTAGTGGTTDFTLNDGSNGFNNSGGKFAAGTGSAITFNWTVAGPDVWTSMAVVWKAAAGASASVVTPRLFALLGVGA